MSHDTAEPMDCSEPPASSSGNCAESKDEVQVTLFVKWLDGPQPMRCDKRLEKVLQSWSNKNTLNGNYKVLEVTKEGRAVIKIHPSPGLSDLQKLCGQTLTSKDGKGVTIENVSLTPPGPEAPIPDNTLKNFPPSSMSELQHDERQVEEQSSGVATSTCINPPQVETQSAKTPPPSPTSATRDEYPWQQSSSSSSAAVSTTSEETCTGTIAVSDFWYLNQMYKKEVEHIIKKHGVQFSAELTVTFQTTAGKGNPQNADDDFRKLARKCSGESSVSEFDLKTIDPKMLKAALDIIQKKENNLLLNLSSEKVIVWGQSQSPEAVRQCFTATENMNHCAKGAVSTWASRDTSPNISMNIEDHLLDTGLHIEENYWKLINTSFSGELVKIKNKFGVDLKIAGISQGQVQINACCKDGKNASMESHALRALLCFYQKIATSHFNFSTSQYQGAMGFSGPPESWSVYPSEGASSGPVLSGHSGYNMPDAEAPIGEGAAGGDNKEETCPICMDPFTNQKQLDCKHGFCEECLESSKKSMGPICPVCKKVFGKIEGDQPNGTMHWTASPAPLPGFPHCGSITISYDIPSGIQEEKHPNPGLCYHGIHRTAYLPNNKEGKEVLQLLIKAFEQKLIFTVGMSRTTGRDNQVTWNDIHHKTSFTGGPQNFGYPDPGYLSRVREELKAKGIE